MSEHQDDQDQADEDAEVARKHRVPLEQYAGIEPSPMPPIAPDGGFVAGYGVGNGVTVPAATAESFICLRGPCRHYWELETFMASGNPADTWDAELGLKDEHGQPIRAPRQISRSCLAHAGTETELTDDCVYACNRWSPLGPDDREDAKRREKYWKLHPEHDPRKLR